MRIWLLLIAILGACGDPGAGGGLTVAANADLTNVLRRLAEDYTTQTGVRVTTTFASSGILREQARRGAPFDLLIVANPKFLDSVEGVGPVVTLASGRLALYGKSVPESVNGLTGRVAIANPSTAPYGESASTYLRAHPAHNLEVVTLDDVRQAKLAVDRGAADYAIVSVTQASEGPLRFVELGPATTVRISAMLVGSSRAEPFLAFLRSETARDTFDAAGLESLR